MDLIVLESGAESGGLALEFANTVASPAHGDTDLLDDPRAFLAWLAQRAPGAVTPPTLRGLPELRIVIDEARRLRTAVRALLRDVSEGDGLAPHLELALARALDAGRWRLSWGEGGITVAEDPAPAPPLALLSPIAASALLLSAQAPTGRLRVCASGECPRWFLDTSKAGRRRWCSMATCGNRAKALRYRDRHGSP